MSSMDIVVGAIILCLIALPLWYLHRNKKKKGTCVGCSCCPLAKDCSSKKM